MGTEWGWGGPRPLWGCLDREGQGQCPEGSRSGVAPRTRPAIASEGPVAPRGHAVRTRTLRQHCGPQEPLDPGPCPALPFRPDSMFPQTLK